MALEAYGQTAAEEPAGTLAIEELGAGGQAHPLALPKSLLPVVPFSPAATALRFASTGPFGAYYVVTESGFDRGVPDKPLSSFVEIFRTYETPDGKPAATVKLGDELTAVVRVRALGRPHLSSLAIVDLLPGGFEPVIQAPAAHPNDAASGDGEGDGDDGEHAESQEGEEGGEGDGEEGEAASGGEAAGGAEAARSFALSVALPGNTFEPEFGDVREDRVVLYGSAEGEVKELKYAIKATNVGTYTVAPVQATALYDSTVVGRGVAGKITVVPR
jgi:uncharacterized protein YfaS (alpha-2-macroglobulin family)